MPAHERAHVLLCGMEDQMAQQLQSLLVALGDSVSRNPHSVKNADLVFCGPDLHSLQRLLRVVKRTQRQIPVVVVSREAEVAAWLDALEAGAADYLAAPFEQEQLQWVRETYLQTRRSTVPAVC